MQHGPLPWSNIMTRKIKRKRYIAYSVMMMPGILYLIINNYLPMAGIIIAFKQINFRIGIWKSPWVGFKNFKFLFQGDAFLITKNTLLYNIAFIILGTFAAVAISILLDEFRGKYLKKATQTVILIPYLISMVVVSYIVNAFLATDGGVVNQILESMEKDPISWYSSPAAWPYILVAVYLWKNFGYQSIIYYSTVIGIDRGLYEAASIDGANRWQRIFHVTLPGLKNTLITLTLMSVGRIFYSDFGLFYQVPMDSGPLMNVTNTIDTYVYRGLMQSNNIGMSSAASVYQSLVGFVLILSANLLVRKISREDALF